MPTWSPNCRIAATLALVAFVSISGCGPAAVGESDRPSAIPTARGGTLVIGSAADVDSWNEYLSRQSFANGLHRRIWLRLAQDRGNSREHPSTFDPQLAESWTAAPDGSALTFRLRPAVWSDGRPVTAGDVRFTWKAQTAPEVGWIAADSKARVRDVEVVDDRTVVFRFDGPYPEQLADAVEGGILPEHVYGAVPFPAWRTHDWSAARVGSGPFLLENYRAGNEITLGRNPRYFDPERPRLDRVVVRIAPDPTTLVTQLLAGAIDFVEGVAPSDAARLRSQEGVEIVAFDYPMYDYVGWNGAGELLSDPEIRRALTMAIDRQAIVDDLLHGFGRVSTGPFLSFWWGADPTLGPWPYDPEAAAKILASRGFVRKGGDGPLERAGRVFEIELTTNAGNRLREAVLVKIQEQLSRIGVRVRAASLEMQTFVRRNTEGRFDAYVGGWRFSGKIDLRSILGSAEVPPKGSNVVRYRSPQLDRLIDEADRAPDWREKKPIYAAMARRIHEDQPYTFLYEARRIAAVRSRVEDVVIDVPFDPLARLESFWVRP